jgi:hypothetical protein
VILIGDFRLQLVIKRPLIATNCNNWKSIRVLCPEQSWLQFQPNHHGTRGRQPNREAHNPIQNPVILLYPAAIVILIVLGLTLLPSTFLCGFNPQSPSWSYTFACVGTADEHLRMEKTVIVVMSVEAGGWELGAGLWITKATKSLTHPPASQPANSWQRNP